jgi:hypothetical protein
MAARAARRVRPEAYDRHVGNVRSPFRRARLANGLSPAAHSRAVLEHQPYDHFALSSSIHRLRKRQRDPDEIDAMYERLCLVAPEAVPADRRPERLAPFLPS